MSVEQLIELWTSGRWVLLAAVIVGFLVRLTKDDTKFPVDLPPKARPYVAIALGAVLMSLEAVTAGKPWREAIARGIIAGAVAIIAHTFGIQWLRDGKELRVPGLMKGDDGPRTPRPPILPLLALAVAASMLLGCPPAARAPSAQSVAGMAISTVALGVKVANDHCHSRVQAVFASGDKQAALDLADKCTAQYNSARQALLAAAYAVDGWTDAANHGKAVCALSEATSSLTLTVSALRTSKAYVPPREVAMALAAVAVVSEMVEARECVLPAGAK